MAHAQDMVAALKTALKNNGLTYADVAHHLGLSQASIKRLFSSGDFGLRRFQQVCELVSLEISDLAQLAEESQRNVEQLSEAQERALVGDTKLLLVAFLLLNHWTFEQIVAAYEVEELEGIRLLAQLDDLKLIELLPENKVRMRLSRTFSWRPDGPIQQFFDEQVQAEFFQTRFDGPGELRLVLNGMITDQSIESIQQRMRRLAAGFEQYVRDDRKTVGTDRLGTTLILAIRPWALEMFERYKRG